MKFVFYYSAKTLCFKENKGNLVQTQLQTLQRIKLGQLTGGFSFAHAGISIPERLVSHILFI